MSLYERFILAKLTRRAMSRPPFPRLREEMLARARGVVLDVGMGAGANLPFLDPAKVDLIYGLEPSAAMRELSREAVTATPIEVRVLADRAEAISLADNTVDTAVLAFVLCTIPDPRAALGEIRRVLKPDGVILYCEHGEAPTAGMRRLQRVLAPFWKRLAGGCHIARPIPQLLTEAGFKLSNDKRSYVNGLPRAGGFIYRGAAVPDASPPVSYP